MMRRQQQQQQRFLAAGSSSNESATARLRSYLLNNYDRGSYPFEYVWNTTASTTSNTSSSSSSSFTKQEGLSVELDISFHKVFDIDVTRSVVDLVVWVRQEWHDPRLAWNPDDYGGLQRAWFWVGQGSGPGGETSEIWTPDLELWNMEESLSTSLTDAHAIVDPDGTVFWSRPGHIKPVCKFSGLDDFPFDSLQCTMEIGSWSYSGQYVRPVRANGVGYSLADSETAGEAFAEYTLVDLSTEDHVYPPFPGSPDDDWPVVFYHVIFARAWEPYVRGYLILQIVLNLAAFCCFWLPPHIGERMGLAITAMLAAVASELVVSANLPAASDVTWFAKFSIVSLLYAASTLFESAAVIYFYYHTGDDLIPGWYKGMVKRVCGGGKDDDDDHNDNSEDESTEERLDPDSDLLVKQNGKPTSSMLQEGNGSKNVSFSGIEADNGNHDNGSVKSRDMEFVGDEMKSSSASMKFQRQLSKSASTRKGIKAVLGRDADDYKNPKEMENNIRWQSVARRIDSFARVVFPASYGIFLAIALTGSVPSS